MQDYEWHSLEEKIPRPRSRIQIDIGSGIIWTWDVIEVCVSRNQMFLFGCRDGGGCPVSETFSRTFLWRLVGKADCDIAPTWGWGMREEITLPPPVAKPGDVVRKRDISQSFTYLVVMTFPKRNQALLVGGNHVVGIEEQTYYLDELTPETDEGRIAALMENLEEAEWVGK